MKKRITGLAFTLLCLNATNIHAIDKNFTHNSQKYFFNNIKRDNEIFKKGIFFIDSTSTNIDSRIQVYMENIKYDIITLYIKDENKNISTVGFAIFQKYDTSAHLCYLFIDENYRSKGLGEKFLSVLLDNSEYKYFNITTLPSNEKAKKFYINKLYVETDKDSGYKDSLIKKR